MKKLTALFTALLMTALTSCGDTSATDRLIAKQESASSAAKTTAAAVTEAAPAAPAESTSEEGASYESEIDDYLSYVPPPSTKSFAEGIDAKNGDIDVDLTLLNATMTYSQVYDMVVNPDLYKGKKVRACGTFAHVNEDGEDFFAAIVKDATACCSQGIEFVLAGEHKFPDDYPPLDSDIVVTGTFDSYQVGIYTYVRLLDATLETAAEQEE